MSEKDNFTCHFCGKVYKSESRFIKHSCLKKQRFMVKDDKSVRIGCLAFQIFYKITCNSKKLKDYTDFSSSQFYTDFCKFGKYVVDVNAVEVEDFVRFLIKNQIPLKQWCDDEIYYIWVRELMKKESAETALERNFLLVEQWAREEGENWKEFFTKVNIMLAIKWIKSGRISPWLIYNSVTGSELFNRLSPEQLVLVEEWIDPVYWSKVFTKNKEDVESIRKLLKEEHI